MCKLLSLLYCPPSEDIVDILGTLEEEVMYSLPEKIYVIDEMKAIIEQKSLEDLKIGHAKLFVGPFDLLAPPYGSVYLDSERRIMGDSTMEALNIYRQAGLNPDPDFKEPPDHITTELEFIYYLTAKYLSSEDSQWLELRRQFIDEHLNKWVNQFAKKVKDSKIVFYHDLVVLTKDILSII